MNRDGPAVWGTKELSAQLYLYSVPLGKLLHPLEPQFPILVVGSR